MKNTKSQAALEFLTTYGWAFLVILIMISALAYFGILKPSKILPDRCNFGVEIGCIDYQISATANTFIIRLKNSVGEPITIPAVATTGITISSESATSYSCTLDATTGINGGAPPVNYQWSSGTITDFKFTGCNSAVASMIKGEKGKASLKITYYAVKSGSAYIHEVNGEVFTTVI